MTEPGIPNQLPAIPRLSHSIYLGSTRTVILDTDHLLNQVKEGVRTGASLFLLGGPPLRRDRCFASSHVLQELYQPDEYGHRHKWDKLAEQSKNEQWPRQPEAFERFFQANFLSDITFVDVSGMFEEEPSVQQVRKIDPSDAPTAQLAVLLSRLHPIIYARDHSLWKPRLAPPPAQFLAVLTAGRDLDLSESTMNGMSYVGAAIVVVVDGATNRAAALLQIPRWVPKLAVVGGAAWYFIGKERRDKVMNALKPVGKFLLQQAELASRAIEVLSAAVANVPEDERLECRFAEVLAECGDERLLAREIQERIGLRIGSSPAPTIKKIREVVTSSPCFVEGPRYRYRLGRNYSS